MENRCSNLSQLLPGQMLSILQSQKLLTTSLLMKVLQGKENCKIFPGLNIGNNHIILLWEIQTKKQVTNYKVKFQSTISRKGTLQAEASIFLEIC